MRLVKQRKFGECGAACAAMVLGWSLDEVLAKIGNTQAGITNARLVEFLISNGVQCIESLAHPGNVPSILTVPSLNHPGLLHYIVFDGEQYLDPACGEKHYPDDAPVVNGERVPPQWATAILLWEPHR